MRLFLPRTSLSGQFPLYGSPTDISVTGGEMSVWGIVRGEMSGVGIWIMEYVTMSGEICSRGPV